MKSYLGSLRIVALLEGISLLLLLGVSMPLKYIWDMPEPTYIVGMAHGVLFIAYGLLVLLCMIKYKWSFLTGVWCMVGALLPFGTFVADAKIFKPALQKMTQ